MTIAVTSVRKTITETVSYGTLYSQTLDSLNSNNTVKPSLTATSPQWPPLHKRLFFCFGRQSINWLLFKPLFNGHLSTTARVTEVRPQLPKKTLKNSQFFQGLIKNLRMVMQFDLYVTLMIKRGNIILIVFHLFCFSKHKFHTILKPMLRTLLVWSCKHVDSRHFYQILSLHFIYDLITIMEYSCKHEFSTINMLYCLTKLSFYTPTSPWWPFLHNSQFLLSTRWPLWRGSTELLLSFIYQGLLRHLELLSC